jgi:hypothetical protein
VAVAVRKCDKEINEGELLFDPRHDIIAVCAPLIEILSDDTFRIVHLSVKEYLFDPSRGEESYPFSLSPASSNADIGSALPTLLSFDEFAAANSIDLLDGPYLGTARNRLEAQAMLAYGLRNWHLHCIESGSSPRYQSLVHQFKEYVSLDYSYLWMESLAKHESRGSWIYIENELYDWNKAQLIPGLIYDISLRRRYYLSKIIGPNHPKALAALANHAYVYGNNGDWVQAEKYELEVVKGRRKALPESHPDILVAMANLARTYWNRGFFNQAAQLEIEVLQTPGKSLGIDHEDTLMAMANLACTYKKLGQRDEAKILEFKVLEGRRRLFGDNHPDTLTAMGYMAVSFRIRGKLKEAEALDTEVLENSRRRLGENHPETLRAMGRLAGTYQAQERWDDAESLGRKALEGCINTFITNLNIHPDSLSAMASLALTYSNKGRFQEAENLQDDVAVFRRWTLGAQHPDTIAAAASLTAIRQLRMDAEIEAQTKTLSLASVETVAEI